MKLPVQKNLHQTEGESMSKRIMLVDDEPLILKGLQYTLEQEGYEVISAARKPLRSSSPPPAI